MARHVKLAEGGAQDSAVRRADRRRADRRRVPESVSLDVDRVWRYGARCAGGHINLMFPGDRLFAAEVPAEVARLRAEYCWQCPVRTECLRDGMAEEAGIWGGLTPEERRKVSQLNCRCGQPIDPRDLLSLRRRHFCADCMPIAFERSGTLRT